MTYLKHFLLGSIFFALSSALVAQTASIKGMVVNSNQQPISDVDVYVSQKKWARTSTDGTFEISNLSIGKYLLVISHVSFENIQKEIEIKTESEILDFEIVLKELIYESASAVVTATRSAQDIESVSISVDVIGKEEIDQSGANTLKDLLLEQAGIALSPDEGNAIQIQGFESDYTLILIDGQPMIGRLRGALNINRINTSNIQQVEIVKGPSSALWGSEALAGVINIITKKPSKQFSGNAFSEYGSRATYNSGASISYRKNKVSGTAGIALDGSNGFDLSDTEFGKNQNPYDNISLNSSLNFDVSELTSVKASARYFKNSFSGKSLATVQGQELGVNEDGWQDDLSFQLTLDSSPFSRVKTTAIVYATRYEDFALTKFEDPTQIDITNNNKQGFDKGEIQANYYWLNNSISTFGSGLIQEFVNAERFQGQRNQHGSFVFVQHQLIIVDKLNITGGARLDNHSSYNSYLSPKLSAKFDLNDNFSIRASVGKGFKAPDLRTLYLNFDNAGSGYRLYGVNNIGSELELLEAANLVDSYLVDKNSISSLEPEFSTAFNFGVSYKLFSDTWVGKINFFRNNAQNLIEALEVAQLTDNSSIFGYVNINKARTEGAEFDQSYTITKEFRVHVGYQYLRANQIITEPRTVIENGTVVTKNFERSVPLPKRPLHSGTVKVFYKEPFLGTELSIRGQLRSRHFFNDWNANRIADSNEYANAYSIWNMTISKQFNKTIHAQIGANNVFDHTDAEYLRFQPGASLFTKLLIEF